VNKHFDEVQRSNLKKMNTD